MIAYIYVNESVIEERKCQKVLSRLFLREEEGGD